MYNFFDNVCGALARVWKKQMDIPMPEFLREREQCGKTWETAAFPLTGWIAGTIITLPAVFIAWLFNIYAGTVVYALGAWTFMVFRDSGRSDGIIAEIFISKFPDGQNQWRAVIPVLLQVIKFALFSVVFLCGNCWHLAMITGGMFLMEAILTLDGGFAPPLLDDSENSRRRMWITAIILGIISIILCRMPALFGIAAFIVIWKIFQNRGEKVNTNFREISFAGAVTGWVLLLAGVLTV